MKGVLGSFLVGLLLITGNLWYAGSAYAQSGKGEVTEQQRREMEQRYQERWRDLERENQKTSGERLREAEKRRQDAQKRQRQAERQMQEADPPRK